LTYNYVALKSRSGGVGTGNANTGQLMDLTSSQINGQQRNESYNYDQVARLAQASGFYSPRNYSYDQFGNRTGVSGGSTQSVTLQHPGGGVTNNRIASVNSGPSYQYDAAGDVTYDAVHSFSYDAESRIVKVDGGSYATYSYDAANRRVKKVAGGHTTYYVWQRNKVIAEYGDAPAGSGGTRFYHLDRLSNRMITDASGAVKGTMDNLPFGEDGGTVGESEKHRFTSYERDGDGGTDYAVNRHYHSATGRFIEPDPFPGSYDFSNPQSLNRYTYVTNDPVNAADPLGLVKRCVPSSVPGDEGCVFCWDDKDPKGNVWKDCSGQRTDTNLPGTGPVKYPCAAMADRGQRLANESIRKAGGANNYALALFDRAFSQAYLGNNGIGKGVLEAIVFSFKDIRYKVPFADIGEDDFKPQFREGNKGDQTHHFAAFLSAGINGQNLIAGAHMWGTDFNNKPDRELGWKAYFFGEVLEEEPSFLKIVGQYIRKFICE